MRRERRGFTMIELLVALSIGAVVLSSARVLLDGIGAQAGVTARAMRTSDARANAERTARQVVGNIALAPNGRPTFAGTSDEARFDSWCPSARGGLEPCHVQLAVRHGRGERTVALSLSTGQSIVLGRGFPAHLRYLSDASSGGRWDPQWSATQTPPLAIAVTTGRDVLFLRVGERR